MGTEVHAANRAAWRSWLRRNHAKAKEAWLVFYKKGTGRPSVAYPDSVEEALCFGWIDGMKKRLDDERYAYRFTPRRPGSKWSPLNVRTARRLIAEGRMAKAGLAAFERRVGYGPEVARTVRGTDLRLSSDLERAIRSNRRAWENFESLAPGYRKRYVQWLMVAKRPGTRARRLKETIDLLERNQKLGMK
jgi:uncharacterized protein YdeI (YjbR/CyaY-like superfamily)